jgi:hypothetical protein
VRGYRKTLIHVHGSNEPGRTGTHTSCYNTIESLLLCGDFKSTLTSVEGDKMGCNDDLYVYTPLKIVLEEAVVAAVEML